MANLRRGGGALGVDRVGELPQAVSHHWLIEGDLVTISAALAGHRAVRHSRCADAPGREAMELQL